MLKKLLNFTKKEWAYIFYDWAESAHTVIIASFVFISCIKGQYQGFNCTSRYIPLSTNLSCVFWWRDNGRHSGNAKART